jgi:hypothetical protein
VRLVPASWAKSDCSRRVPGNRMVPAGRVAPWISAPVRASGTLGPIPRARRGLAFVRSSHRPSQPVPTGVPGTPLCQMSIDSKWL